jgi:hypothetical protein
MRKILLFVVIFLSIVSVARAETTPASWKLPEHEKMVFKVRWMGITGGEITSEIKGFTEWHGRKAYVIEVRARSVGFCATLFKVDSRYTSYLDAEKLYTLRSEVDRHEGHYKKHSVTEFDQEKHMAYFESFTDGSKKTFKIRENTQDTVTAAFVARTQPFGMDKLLELNICNNERNYSSAFNVVEKIKMSVPGFGKREVFHIRPTDKFYGKYVHKGRMHGYVDAGPGHVPYRIVIKAPVFTSVTALLVDRKTD